jgi:ProP effector
MTKRPSSPPRANRQATGGSKAGVFDPANLAAPAEAAKTCEKNFVGAPNGARDDIKRIQKTIAVLAERWPRCFVVFEKRRRPLKVGIFEDIAAVAPDLDPADLAAAIRFYVGNLHYLAACVAGASRIGLNGEVCDEVTAKDAESAALRFANILRRQAARRQTSPSPPPAPSTSKRDGLAALRAAALARKQQGQAS